MRRKLEADLASLSDELVDQNAQREFSELKPVYTTILRFISKNKLIVYGGTALNEIVPKAQRFYAPTDPADFDCFCVSPMPMLKRLAKEIFDSGVKYVHVKRAFHEGTFTLMVNFQPVVDLTAVPRPMYERMLQLSKSDYAGMSGKLRFIPAPIYFLKYSMHYELGKPESSGHRWDKVFSRLELLNAIDAVKSRKTTPIQLFQESNATYAECVRTVLEYTKKHGLAIGGNYAWLCWMSVPFPEKTLVHPDMGFMDILSTDAYGTGRAIEAAIKARVPHMKLHVRYTKDPVMLMGENDGSFKNHTTVLPACFELRMSVNGESRKLLVIYDTTHECMSVMSRRVAGGQLILSPDSLLRYIYANAIIKTEYAPMYENIALTLERGPMAGMSVKQRFSTRCYGRDASLVETKMDLWDKKQKVVVYIPE
jgi:hypothetical protein